MRQITVAIATIVALAIALTCVSAQAEEFYPKLAIVVEVEYERAASCWLVTCEDKDGELWGFYTTEEKDWIIGDIVNLLMWTEKEEQEVFQVYKEGHTDNIKQWKKINGWR